MCARVCVNVHTSRLIGVLETPALYNEEWLFEGWLEHMDYTVLYSVHTLYNTRRKDGIMFQQLKIVEYKTKEVWMEIESFSREILGKMSEN